MKKMNEIDLGNLKIAQDGSFIISNKSGNTDLSKLGAKTSNKASTNSGCRNVTTCDGTSNSSCYNRTSCDHTSNSTICQGPGTSRK